jgi:hypothetical protein
MAIARSFSGNEFEVDGQKAYELNYRVGLIIR